MDEPHHDEYDDDFVAGLEWIWGDGFLSPGGSEEVARILGDADLAGKTVLDIGCGVGGIDVLLVEQHGAAHVTGIDVETALIETSKRNVQRAGLSDRIAITQVTPGPLVFDDDTYDVVFSKDSMIHIPDKAQIYSEIFRVLKPGGRLCFSDWFGSAAPETSEFIDWLDVVKLSFRIGTIESAAELIASTGFEDVEFDDRNAWYAQYMVKELERCSGTNFDKLAKAQGQSVAEHRLRSSSLKKIVVDQGQLRPGHVRATKPVALVAEEEH